MDSAFRRFLRRFSSVKHNRRSGSIFVGAFGKHPGWDDHIDDLGDPQSITSLDIITDQELLDAGLTDCVDSARFHGTDLGFFFFWEGPFLCGAFSPAMMLLTVAGLIALRQRFWSRRSCG